MNKKIEAKKGVNLSNITADKWLEYMKHNVQH